MPTAEPVESTAFEVDGSAPTTDESNL